MEIGENDVYLRILLPVWKQGDNFDFCMDEDNDVILAFRSQSKNYNYAANRLDQIASILADYPDVKVQAEGHVHSIGLVAPKEIADQLIKMDLAEIDEAYYEMMEEETEHEEVDEVEENE